MLALVHRVLPDSPAHKAGFKGGERIVAINGNPNLEDLFDYQFEIADERSLTLTVEGQTTAIRLTKGPDEDPGLVFASPIFTPIKTCNNACPFCFIDQQPEGLRSTLYIKDDDYRLSAFNNTYITLTNLTARDRVRIERIRPGPLYISVHATEPEIRRRLLKNPKAQPVMDELRWLKALGIPFHCQVVICPGLNDGEVLTQTLVDLETLRPEALSVAVVPLGLTRYRDTLPDLVPVNAACALDVIERLKGFKAAADFVYLSDEFYFYAGLPLPQEDTYGDYPQLEDGVGTSRMLLEGFWALESELPEAVERSKAVMIVTGKLAAMTLQPIVQRLNQIEGLFVDVLPVESHFWGNSVHVAGLITAADLWDALNPLAASGELAKYEALVLPSVMLKSGFLDPQHGEFLDGETVAGLSGRLGCPIRIVKDPYDASDLVNQLIEPLKHAVG